MGASSSSTSNSKESQALRETEGQVASTGALPLLQNFFSSFKDPQSITLHLQSLHQCFCLEYKSVSFEAPQMPASFPELIDQLGASVVNQFFVPEKGGVSWLEFLLGYLKCCGRMSASASLIVLLRLYAAMASKAGNPLNLEFVSIDEDFKVKGSLSVDDVLTFLSICWVLFFDSRTTQNSQGNVDLCVPDISDLVLSAVGFGGENDKLLNSDITDLDIQVSVDLFVKWVLTTVPCLTDCFAQFFNARLQKSTISKGKSENVNSPTGEVSTHRECIPHLLTSGRGWAISLTLRGTISEEILKPFFLSDNELEENLLYRSSSHGRGLNRFWSNVDGYNGPLLILVSAHSGDTSEDVGDNSKWIIGVLILQGLENKDTFYGTSGTLYAIHPVFHMFSPAGKEKNFIYSHLHPTGRVYEPHPKPVGVAFGGTVGNERIFIDEDFAKVTVRHHAVDKTYQPGSLTPCQGYLPVEAPISEVEVWGLGGNRAKSVQASYKKREELFTEQRRKVDLKTFASWEDSPEKMMMDMMADPNRVRREDR